MKQYNVMNVEGDLPLMYASATGTAYRKGRSHFNHIQKRGSFQPSLRKQNKVRVSSSNKSSHFKFNKKGV